MTKKKAAGKVKARSTKSKPKSAKAAVSRVVQSRPKDRVLTGLEDIQIPDLDDVAGSIADVRAQFNELKGQEKELLETALALLHEHKRTVWKAHGVELVCVPGTEKVRVRLVKDDNATGGATDDEPFLP